MKKVFSLILGMLGLTLLLFTCNLNVNAVAETKTFTITSNDLGLKQSYGSGNEQVDVNGVPVTFEWVRLMNGKSSSIQGNSKDVGSTLFNSTPIPGSITEITLNMVEAANNVNVCFNKDVPANEQHIEEVHTPNELVRHIVPKETGLNHFALKWPKGAAYIKEIKVQYTESTTPVETATVSFNSNGGSLTDDVKVVVGNKLTNLPVPVKPGFKFAGWYKEEGLVNIWNEETDVVTANMTLYAKWEESNLVQVTSVEELVSAKYIVKANKLYLGSYSKKFLTTGNENEATELTIQKSGNGYKISFDDNGETKYITTTVTGSTDIHTTLNKMDAYVSTIELAKEGNNLFTVNLGSNRRLALNNDKIGAYLVDNSQYSPVELYKVKGSEMADEVAFVEEFVQTKTLSSLKMTYDVETTTAIDVDLRFGTVLKASAYDASAKYGVLLVKKEAGINFANGKQTEATALEFVNNHAGVKSLEATNIARVDDNGAESETGNNYQFAWVVTNMEEVGYATELIAVTYVEYDGALYFANQTSYSVKSLCQKYINDNVSEVVNNATVKAVFENIIKG